MYWYFYDLVAGVRLSCVSHVNRKRAGAKGSTRGTARRDAGSVAPHPGGDPVSPRAASLSTIRCPSEAPP
jgi:hypothetical protein